MNRYGAKSTKFANPFPLPDHHAVAGVAAEIASGQAVDHDPFLLSKVQARRSCKALPQLFLLKIGVSYSDEEFIGSLFRALKSTVI